jgi:hypothetical protein
VTGQVSGEWAGNLYLADLAGVPVAVARLNGTVLTVSAEGDGKKAGPIIGRMYLQGSSWWAWTARKPEMTTTDRQVAVRVSLDDGIAAILGACHACGQPVDDMGREWCPQPGQHHAPYGNT